MSKKTKTLLIWILLIVLFVAFYQVASSGSGPPERDRAALQQDIDAKRIDSVSFDHRYLVVTTDDGASYKVRVKPDAALWRELMDHGARFEAAQPSEASPWLTVLAYAFAIIVVLALFVALLRRFGGSQSIFSLRKTTARYVSKPPSVTFADVGGAPEVKQRLADIVDFLKRPAAWQRAGARLPKGVLLEGPPGSGKTLLARAVAGEAKVPFYEVSASEFVELFVGVGSARVRDLFEQAGKKPPAVIFIDELDAVGRRRGSGSLTAGHQEREQTLNQLLVSLDGFQGRTGVVVIAATNRADILDAALLRPGRFDIHLKLPRPSEQDRAQILAIHLKGKPQGVSISLTKLAQQTEGFSGAALEHLVNEAAVGAVRRTGRTPQASVTIEDEDFQAAIVAHRAREGGFDNLDRLLIESGSQLSRPEGRVVLRATLEDGSSLSGEVLWADERFLKLRKTDGATITLPKARIYRVEALTGTSPASEGELHTDGWARAVPESA